MGYTVKILGTLIFSCLVMQASVAKAALLIEPYVGYGSSNIDAHVKPVTGLPNGLDTDMSLTEVSIGSRLGILFESGFWVAADPQIGLAGMRKNYDGTQDAYTRTQVFADVGIDFGMLRLFAGYAPLNENKADGTISGGAGIKAGLGIQILSNVNLVAEYHSNTFEKFSGTEASGNINDNYDKFSETGFMVGVSFPFGQADRR